MNLAFLFLIPRKTDSTRATRVSLMKSLVMVPFLGRLPSIPQGWAQGRGTCLLGPEHKVVFKAKSAQQRPSATEEIRQQSLVCHSL